MSDATTAMSPTAREALTPWGYRARGMASVTISLAVRVTARGCTQCMPRGVDAENSTGAYGVYEGPCFAQERREVMVSKTS